MKKINENAKEAARRLSLKAINKGFQPEALHEYTDIAGNILYWRIRLKNPKTGEKWIRPMRYDEAQCFLLKEPNYANGTPLYNLHQLQSQGKSPVIVVEGEWCVDRLARLGALSTTSGGSGSVEKTDMQPLAGRLIIIWPDNDEPGKLFAQAFIKKLKRLNCEIRQINVDTLNLPEKGDVIDWLEMNPSASMGDILKLPMAPVDDGVLSSQDDDTAEEELTDKSQTTALVDFTKTRVKLFHDKNSAVYAQDLSTGETRRLDGRQFKDWLIDCLRPETPFPVLEFIGEQGSAKSTTQTILRRLIDPNSCDLRAAPKTIEDIFVSAGVNWLVSYENISYLSPPVQDALCVLATGGGFAKRKLYSDADEAVILVKRPVVLNGISAAVTAQDLIDRTISIETPLIKLRMEITDLWGQYKLHHASLLGALLSIFSTSLSRLKHVQLPQADRPRLAEFAKLGMAVAESLDKTGEEFLTKFNASRQESIARTIDASPVASALIEWFEDSNRRTTVLPVKQLFLLVERKKPLNTDSWPHSAKGFADALRRIAPALRSVGIECRSLGKTGSYVSWEIKQKT